MGIAIVRKSGTRTSPKMHKGATSRFMMASSAFLGIHATPAM